VRIDGIEDLTLEEVDSELAAGGRFVFFEYCVSLVILTLRCPTSICLLRAGEWGLLRSLPCTLVSLILGWWGLPWGVIYTPLVIFSNLRGGHDVTDQVYRMLCAGPRGQTAVAQPETRAGASGG
jgi:hypothetical protein